MARKRVVKLSEEEYALLNQAKVLLAKKGTEKLSLDVELEDLDLGTIVSVAAQLVVKTLKSE